ncbi:MAG TPA: ATP-binding protein [Steroidobacteraceae bacterium]|nr:ATP-binding protein [Steroidobacteraceae bacterium]
MPQPSAHHFVLRSAAFRLAGLQAALFALIVVVLFGVTWGSIGLYVEQRVDATAVDKLHGAIRVLDAVPLNPVRSDALDLDSSQYFGLFDRSGRYLAGAIDVLPGHDGNVRMPLRGVAWVGPVGLHVVRGELADGRQLVVGVDRARADALLGRVRRAYLTAGLAGLVAALAVGFLTARRYLGRVEKIAAVAAEIVNGRLDTRLVVTAQNDEIDRLSVALNATWQRIELLLEGMRQISTDIAHELRTPLAHLRFRLEQTCSAIDPREPAHAAVSRSIQDVDHVLAIFGALLRIAQIHARQRRAGFEPVDMSQLVGAAVADYRPLFEDDGRLLHAEIQGEVGIVGDRMLLQQLLVNLIENALRHTSRGAALTVSLLQTPEYTELSVTDSGPGIPESQRERVLQRLVRLDAARGAPGAGLGLALVKAISDLHEASLSLLDAQPGLRVQIRLPRIAT